MERLPRIYLNFIVVFFILFMVCLSLQALAEETDQYTLPPAELDDMGPITSLKLYEVISKVIEQTNSDIRCLSAQAKHSRHAQKLLALRRSDGYLADVIYDKGGPGFPRWLYPYPHNNPSMTYKEILPWKTIYWLVFSQCPITFWGLTPTINMYGFYFGSDKLGHFLMQGHTYFKIYSYFISHGYTAEKAHEAMLFYGHFVEHSYLGTMGNSVFSNGDLSANYAGWKFYMNLTHPVKIGKKTLAPLLVLNKGSWEFSRQVNKEDLLKPFISNNLNEALNPSHYLFMRSRIAEHIKKRCPEWIARRGITKEYIEKTKKETSLWHGENYGHWLPDSRAVGLDLCFKDKNP